ncbi:MAG: hypothetical protein NWR72_19010, partial [Bacteroidia bacterium]|nr:hypothetical protein [Bacteroidia bacterium]
MWKHIESYIENHREELDQHTPPGHLWDRIEAKLDAPVPMRRKAMTFDNWVRLAAAIILVLGGAWIWIQFSPKQQLPSSSILPAIHQLHEASPEWNEAEAIYQQEMNQMLSEAGLQTWQDAPAYQELKPAL